MAGERPLTAHGEDRRAALLRAAETLFLERGFVETRMADVAETAGVTKSLLYWYFKSKEALAVDIVLDLRDRLRVAQMDAIAGIDDPLERLYVGTVASVLFIAEHHRVYGLLSYLAQDPEVGEVIARSSHDHDVDAAAIIAEGQHRGVIRTDDDPLVIAIGNAGVTMQHITVWASRQPDDDPRGAAHAAARYIVHAAAAASSLAESVIAAQSVAVRRRRRS